MTVCLVDGCNLPVRSKGMCKNHRQRLLKYGRTEKILTGNKINHPLYRMWNKRKQKENSFVTEWLNFDIFVNAVGSKPDGCFLARPNEKLPCGPNNFEWRKIKVPRLENETTKDYNLRRQLTYRLENPLAARKSNYRISFGLTLEEVEQKLKLQNYVCAICGEAETIKYKNTNKIRTLALDHNHNTGKIRDFLCSRCNHILGRLKENTNILNNMVSYLEKHNK